LTIQLPRNVIDAKTKDSHSPFQVLVEGKKATFQEITNSSQSRILAIDFPGGIIAGQIEIIGSKTVQPPLPKPSQSNSEPSEPSFFTPSEETSVPEESPPEESSAPSTTQTIQVFNGQIGLQSGQLQGYSFSVPANAENIYLKGTLSVSGGAISSVTIKLYDKDQCPPPDSQGRIDLSSCTPLLNQDYSTGEEIDKYIPHGGTFYLYLQDSSSFFNKIVNGNIYVEYLP
jgi:hypothetical protein